MEFSRIGEHTIKCVISEEEIYDLGFTMEEIMSNGERTQEFMNQIFDMAEQEFEMKFDFGVKTVRADFLSNHTLSLTFSEHPVSEGMMEHLKDIVNDLISEHGQKAAALWRHALPVPDPDVSAPPARPRDPEAAAAASGREALHRQRHCEKHILMSMQM